MSANDSGSDFGSDDSNSLKKREREHFEEPERLEEGTPDADPGTVSPKKTKCEPNTEPSVRHIRRNLKEMTTDEKSTTHDMDSQPESQPGSPADTQDDKESAHSDKDSTKTTDNKGQLFNDKKRSMAEEQDDTQKEIEEKPATHAADQPRKRVSRRDSASLNKKSEQNTDESDNESTKASPAASTRAEPAPASPKKISSVFSAFGGGKKDDDDWGEFSDKNEQQHDRAPAADVKPKYTFGSSSDFGFKAYVPMSQSVSSTTGSVSQKPTFGGFSGTGFGSFSSSTTTTTAKLGTTTAFGSFANATSPFALAAASAQTDVLASLPPAVTKLSSSDTTTENAPSKPDSNASGDESETSENTEDSVVESPTCKNTIGTGIKSKVTKAPAVTTGEEDEDTVYRTKAKLFVLDSASGNWKERGPGIFRINTKTNADNTKQTRLVMRAASVYRVILNLKMFKGMKFFIMQDKFVRFAGFEVTPTDHGEPETVLVNYALKLASPEAARELQNILISCLDSANNGATHA